MRPGQAAHDSSRGITRYQLYEEGRQNCRPSFSVKHSDILRTFTPPLSASFRLPVQSIRTPKRFLRNGGEQSGFDETRQRRRKSTEAIGIRRQSFLDQKQITFNHRFAAPVPIGEGQFGQPFVTGPGAGVAC